MVDIDQFEGLQYVSLSFFFLKNGDNKNKVVKNMVVLLIIGNAALFH